MMGRFENNIERKSKKIERYKNPWFWIGIGGIVLTTLQVEATSLTTWSNVGELIIRTVSNPYLLATTSIAVLGVFVDPSTKGLVDRNEK